MASNKYFSIEKQLAQLCTQGGGTGLIIYINKGKVKSWCK